MEKKYDIKTIIKIAVIIAAIAWCVLNIGGILAGIGKFLSIISPFLYGCIIAFVLNVLMRFIEKKWDDKLGRNNKILNKLKRPVAIALCLLVVFGIVCAIIFLVVPGFYASVMTFVSNVPDYVDKVNGWWANLVAFAAGHDIVLPSSVVDSNDVIKIITEYFSESGSNIINETISKTSSLFSGLINALLSIIFAIYILGNKERLQQSAKDAVRVLVPDDKEEGLFAIARTTEATFSSFVSGQCLEACCFGIMSFIGLEIFRFPYPGMIAIVLGFTTLIPVFGAFIGGAIGFVLIALTSPLKGLYFLIFLVVIQQLDNNLVYPRIVGKSVGLPGMLVLLAVTAGGSGFGILGLLASVPLCAVLYGMYKGFIEQRLLMKQYAEDGLRSENYDVGD